jgi:hypothetical protein
LRVELFFELKIFLTKLLVQENGDNGNDGDAFCFLNFFIKAMVDG